MTTNQIDVLNKIKEESVNEKYVEREVINKLIWMFKGEYERLKYKKTITSPLKLALSFFQEYNEEYYQIILKGIKNKKIVFCPKLKKTYTDINDKMHISLNRNDGDVFLIVHELAHFVAKNKQSLFLPAELSILSEIFPFYLERKLESWLGNLQYLELIETRKANRMYIDSKMLSIIEIELFYEDLCIKKGNITNEDICLVLMDCLVPYKNISNLVNYLLRYPLADILSYYLFNDEWVQADDELISTCLSFNLNKLIDDYFIRINPVKTQKRKSFFRR